MLMSPPPGYNPFSLGRQNAAGPTIQQTAPGPQGITATKPGLPGLSGLPQLSATPGSNPMGGMKMPGVGQPGMPGGGMLGGGAQGMGMGTNPMNMANILRR